MRTVAMCGVIVIYAWLNKVSSPMNITDNLLVFGLFWAIVGDVVEIVQRSHSK